MPARQKHIRSGPWTGTCAAPSGSSPRPVHGAGLGETLAYGRRGVAWIAPQKPTRRTRAKTAAEPKSTSPKFCSHHLRQPKPASQQNIGLGTKPGHAKDVAHHLSLEGGQQQHRQPAPIDANRDRPGSKKGGVPSSWCPDGGSAAVRR
jgi:hypothetical protein